MSEQDNYDNRINNLFKKIATMAAVDAYQFLIKSGEDPEIIDKVTELISDSKTRTQFLSKNPKIEEIFDGFNQEIDLIGQTIGHVKIIELLGKGGMGEVYLGLDNKLNRKVAIKTIHGKHRLSSSIKERFRREARILSKLDHPNICRIYNIIENKDTDFLILEYVQGETLNLSSTSQFSKNEKIQIAECLLTALLVAHDKSIVHRDIKPDNIIVTEKGSAKILDFGISRSLNVVQQVNQFEPTTSNPQTSIKSLSNTSTGSLMGTLGYMCPEQAKGEEATPASDIYSLGIVLQELFTNRSAHPENRSQEMLLQRAKFGTTEEIRDIPRDIKYLIDRMKSPSVEARPKALDALKILKRIKQKPNRILRLVLLTTLLFTAFFAFLKYTYDLREQTHQAEMARDQSEQVTEFLASLFDQNDPYKSKGKTITARKMLDDGAARIDNELATQPHNLSQIKMIIGNVYRQLGLFDLARNQLQNALIVFETNKLIDKQLYIQLLQSLATLEFEENQLDKAEKFLLKAINFSKINHLENDPVSLETKYELAVINSHQGKYKSAEKQFKQHLNYYATENINDYEQISQINNSLGLLYWNQSNPEKALIFMQAALKAIELVKKNLELKTTIRGNMSLILGDLGRYDESIALAHGTVTIRKKLLGENHPNLALAYDNLSYAYYNADRIKECIVWNEKALKIYELTIGRGNKDFAMTLANRAVLLRKNGDLAQAEIALKEVINTLKLSNHNRLVADYLGDLGKIYNLQDRKQDAIEQFEKSIQLNIEIDREMTGSNRFFKAWQQMAYIQNSLGEIDSAKKSYNNLLIKLKSQEKPDSEAIDKIFKELEAVK